MPGYASLVTGYERAGAERERERAFDEGAAVVLGPERRGGHRPHRPGVRAAPRGVWLNHAMAWRPLPGAPLELCGVHRLAHLVAEQRLDGTGVFLRPFLDAQELDRGQVAAFGGPRLNHALELLRRHRERRRGPKRDGREQAEQAERRGLHPALLLVVVEGRVAHHARGLARGRAS